MKKKALKIVLITLMFAAAASAKKKVNLAEYPLTAHVLKHDHAPNISRVEATIGGVTYILHATNISVFHGCHASSLKAVISLEPETDYPAKKIKHSGSDWFQFVVLDEDHPLCDLEVVGIKKNEAQQ